MTSAEAQIIGQKYRKAEIDFKTYATTMSKEYTDNINVESLCKPFFTGEKLKGKYYELYKEAVSHWKTQYGKLKGYCVTMEAEVLQCSINAGIKAAEWEITATNLAAAEAEKAKEEAREEAARQEAAKNIKK